MFFLNILLCALTFLQLEKGITRGLVFALGLK